MKPFNLEEYLANPSRKVVTRDGRDVRIICTDRKGDCPIVALIKNSNGNSEFVASYSKDGLTNEYASALYDLFFAPEKHEGWITLYKNVSGGYVAGERVHNRKEDAESWGGSLCVATVKIEWEE